VSQNVVTCFVGRLQLVAYRGVNGKASKIGSVLKRVKRRKADKLRADNHIVNVSRRILDRFYARIKKNRRTMASSVVFNGLRAIP